ncbi:MAG: lamin tail domain-containing protein [Anaerolineales bacterium]
MLRGRTFFLRCMGMLFVLGVLVGAPGSGAVRAAPKMNPQRTNGVISEFRTSGPAGKTDEFIEIFNPTTTNPIDISGWELWEANVNSPDINLIFTFPVNTTLASGQHYLVANTGWGGNPLVTPNGTYSYDIPDNGGIALIDPVQNVKVDSVGMTQGLAFTEGTPLSPFPANSDQSYERRQGGALGNCTDTDNNAFDFKLISPTGPQNLDSTPSAACTTAPQTITITKNAPAGATVNSTFSVAATSDSGLQVAYTASGVCTNNGAVFTVTSGSGDCIVHYNQAGDGINYDAAPEITETVNETKAAQAITVTQHAPSSAAYNSAFTVAASGGASLNPVVYSASGGCTNNAAEFTMTSGKNACIVHYNQTGNDTYAAAPEITESVSAIKIGQTITFTSTAPTNAAVAGPTYTPSASATSGLPVAFKIDSTASAVCGINVGIVYFKSYGTCVIDANQAGNDNYNAALQVQQSFNVNPTPATHLVISEFSSRGPKGDGDEFVEIYNPTGGTINISSWTIKTSGGCTSPTRTTITTLVTMSAGTTLQPGQHYLAAAVNSTWTQEGSSVKPDKTFEPGIDDDGGVALVNLSGQIQDMAGMCVDTTYHEGTIVLPPFTEADYTATSMPSYERKPAGTANCFDTNDNLRDFARIDPADPQNTQSPKALCSGVYIFTVTPTLTPSPTRTPTRAPTVVPGNVVLNEFLPHPRSDWNGDGTVNTGDEYIEIINMGTSSINVSKWKLDNGAGSANSYTLPNLTLVPRQIAVFYHADTGIGLSDVGSSVRLLKSDGHTADIYNYSLVTAADRTWCRLPDGNGGWGFVCQPTPGKPNEAAKSGTPGAGEVLGSVCVKNLAPATVLTAECNSPGGKMWGEGGTGEIWLDTRLKFDVFVE